MIAWKDMDERERAVWSATVAAEKAVTASRKIRWWHVLGVALGLLFEDVVKKLVGEK